MDVIIYSDLNPDAALDYLKKVPWQYKKSSWPNSYYMHYRMVASLTIWCLTSI